MSAYDDIIIEKAEIVYRNFSGAEKPFNNEGERNFCLVLTPELEDLAVRSGWNVKRFRPREEEEIPKAYVKVSVGYKFRPPKVVLLTSKGRTDLGEEEIDFLDDIDFELVDLIIKPAKWQKGSNSGIKIWLRAIFVTAYESELDKKYADIQYIGEQPAPVIDDERYE